MIDSGDMDLIVIIGASAVLFGLVVARMAGLVRQQERSVARERTLTGAGAALVAATSRDEIARAALDAIVSLVGSDAEALLCLVEEDGAARRRRADRLHERRPGRALRPRPPARCSAPPRTTRRAVLPLTAERRADLRLGGDDRQAVVLGLSVRAETRGVLVVCGEHADARAARRTACARSPPRSRSRSRAPR